MASRDGTVEAMKGQAATHINAARARLAHLGGIAAKTDAAERSILDAAQRRLDEARTQMDQLRPRVGTDPAAAEDYQRLTLEMGRLATIVAQAQHHLGER